jgi:hypothetical protein
MDVMNVVCRSGTASRYRFPWLCTLQIMAVSGGLVPAGPRDME